jgi:hypothetical protein
MQQASRQVRNQLKSALHGVFVIGQRFGVDILPRHFYSGIPSVKELRDSDGWKMPSSMIGVAGSELDPQLALLRELCLPLRHRLFQGGIHEHACRENGEPGYGVVESDVLFCFIYAKRPKRIIQLGCGVATAVMLLAAKEAGYTPEVVCVDPYPTPYLIGAAKQGLIKLEAVKAQDIDLQILTDLNAGDLLFIDTTHAVKPNSEVNRLVLEVLPRIPESCFVHVHDIYFPYDYMSTLLTTVFFTSESTLVHAFLIGNSRYSIAMSLSMLHHGRQREMQDVLPAFRPCVMQYGLHDPSDRSHGHFPSALYLSVR